MIKNQYYTKVLLYGNPPFALMYFRNKRWIGLDLQQFRPDPILYIKKGKIYNSNITLKSNGTRIKNMNIDGKKYIIIP